ncbi:MAG TPA: RNA polymerase sigma factor [Actinomycetota bacterium]|nr:RNA polymerase sigma factor [Actinomycetota bacterium]
MYAVDQIRTQMDEDDLDPLAARAAGGDLDAFEQLVLMLQGPMRSLCRRILRDDQLGDDAAQESLVRMWRGLGERDTSGRFVAWAFTVARNTSVEMLRREVRRPVPVDEVPVAGDPTDALDLRHAVQAAVAALEDPFRTTFVLREAGMSYEEVAEAEGCPVGTVRSRLHEARRRLAESLSPWMFER